MQSRQKVRILHVTPSWVGHSYKNPKMGLKNRVQMPHPGATSNLYLTIIIIPRARMGSESIAHEVEG